MRKRRWWMLIPVGIVLAVFAGIRALQEPLLLEKATRIAAADDFSTWVSDHEFLRIDEPWPIDSKHMPTITRCDVRTGRTQSYIVHHYPVSTHAALSPSPDGRWALCWNGTGTDTVWAVNLQTGQARSWPSEGDTYHYSNYWLPDSRHWVQGTTLPDGYLTVFDVEAPTKSLRLPFPDYRAVRWHDPDVTMQNHLLFHTENPEEGNNPTGDGPPSIIVREYDLLPKITLLRTVTIPPERHRVNAYQPCFSPAGDCIAWMCDDDFTQPLMTWLHRWIPMVRTAPQHCFRLWVSRSDGSRRREIGYIPLTGDDQETLPDTLEWLPDGRHLSFVYKDELWTVPVE